MAYRGIRLSGWFGVQSKGRRPDCRMNRRDMAEASGMDCRHQNRRHIGPRVAFSWPASDPGAAELNKGPQVCLDEDGWFPSARAAGMGARIMKAARSCGRIERTRPTLDGRLAKPWRRPWSGPPC